MFEVTRAQLLQHRRRAGGLTGRAPRSDDSIRSAAWVGLQDSVPRAALVSLHARVAGTEPDDWNHASLIGVWGPRFSAYVVPEVDRVYFTLGRLSNAGVKRDRSERLADRLGSLLGDGSMMYREAGAALGVDHNALRYAAQTGRVALHWDGANPPIIWMVPRPDLDPLDARTELLRRYLHVFGTASVDSFRRWAGIGAGEAKESFAELSPELLEVSTPIGEEWMLGANEESIRSDDQVDAAVRLLPSGDAYTLLTATHRELLVPDPERAAELWPSRVWPGAVLVGNEVVGVWRRAAEAVTISLWGSQPKRAIEQIAAEAERLPIPGLERPITVTWT